MKKILMIFLYMILAPLLYIAIVCGAFEHNNYDLDGVQIALLVLIGFKVVLAIFITHLFVNHKNVDNATTMDRV